MTRLSRTAAAVAASLALTVGLSAGASAQEMASSGYYNELTYGGPNHYNSRFYGPRAPAAQTNLRRQHQAYDVHKQTLRRARHTMGYMGPNRYSSRFYGPRIQYDSRAAQRNLLRRDRAHSTAHRHTLMAEHTLRAPRD